MSTAVSRNRAAVVAEYTAPVQVWDVEVPDPEDGALIVAVDAATMCGTDVHIHAGDFERTGFSKLPLVLGHETVGRVVAIGARPRRDALGRTVKVGDRIAWAYAWCGECYWCSVAKQPTLCAFARQYGWGPATEFPYATGGFAEYAYVMPSCKVVLVPDNLDGDLAASTTCAFRTVVHGFERAGGLTPSDNVVIQGAGAVGLYALAYALGSGARQVIVVGAPAERLAIAGAWGAHEVIDIETTDAAERTARVKELTEGRGADLVVECAGNRFALEEGVGLARRGGTYLVLGQSDPKPSQLLGTSLNQGQLAVIGSVSADVSHYYRALRFVSDNHERFPFGQLLGRSYPLSAVTDALAAIAAGRETKPVIRPGSDAETLVGSGDEQLLR